MKGKNTIDLCKSEMIEAMQMWVDSRFAQGHRQTVEDISESEKYDSGFILVLNDNDRPGPATQEEPE